MQVVLCLTALVIYTTEVATPTVKHTIIDYFSVILCSIIAAFEVGLSCVPFHHGNLDLRKFLH
jgi:hypothetical protein